MGTFPESLTHPQIMKSHRPLVTLLVGLLIPLGILHGEGAFEVSDTFVSGSQGETVPLEGSETSAGAASWTATDNVLLAKDEAGGFVTTKNTNVYRASVPVPTVNGSLIVEGTVNPVDGIDRPNWVAIGLGTDGTNFTWEQGIFLLVDSRGNYEGAVNVPEKGIVRLKRDKVPDLEDGKPVTLLIDYSPTTGVLDMSVNGVEVIIDKTLEEDQRPKVDCAGFSGFGQKSGSLVTNQFRVSEKQ